MNKKVKDDRNVENGDENDHDNDKNVEYNYSNGRKEAKQLYSTYIDYTHVDYDGYKAGNEYTKDGQTLP